MRFPRDSGVKNLPANAGDAGLIPGSRRYPGEGNGYPLQYPCLENSMDREVFWATVINKYLEKRIHSWDFPGGPVVKNAPANAEDVGSVPGPGRSHVH